MIEKQLRMERERERERELTEKTKGNELHQIVSWMCRQLLETGTHMLIHYAN